MKMILSHSKKAVALYSIWKSSQNFVHGLAVTNKAVNALDNGMDYVKLGSSDLDVSRVCMGTMTFGEVSSNTKGRKHYLEREKNVLYGSFVDHLSCTLYHTV